MNKYFVYIYVALALFGIASCEQEYMGGNFRQSVNAQAPKADLEELLAIASSPQRSKSEALAIASQLVGTTNPVVGKKLTSVSSGSDFEVDCVLAAKAPMAEKRIMSSTVEPEEIAVDTLLYVINQRNNNGFFLISGDKRLPDVLAYVPQGHLDVKNVDDSLGLSVFLSRLPIYYEQTLDKFNATIDSLVSKENLSEISKRQLLRKKKKQPQFEYEYSDWIEVSRTPNLVPVKWGQRTPYNDEAPVINGEHALSGCVATAVAQLAASFKYPSLFRGVAVDWNFLTWYPQFGEYSGTTSQQKYEYQHQTSHFIRKIGDALGNSWGINGTAAKTQNIPNVLREMGYQRVNGFSSFNGNETISSIAQNSPVVLVGCAETYKHGWFITRKRRYGKAHAWLSDGLLREERTVKKLRYGTKKVLETKQETVTLLHCNWGWDGYCDGYFFPGIFDTANPSVSDGRDAKGQGYYRYIIQNLLYVHP